MTGQGEPGVTSPRPDQHYEPPAGGQAIPGARSVVRARTVIISGSGAAVGIFVYSGNPAAGNLAESITAANGTDPFGNATLAGFTSYYSTGGTFYAMQVAGGPSSAASMLIYTATSQAGPYTFQGSMVSLSLALSAISTSYAWNWNVTGNAMNGNGTGGNPLLSLINSTSGNTAMALSLIAAAAGDPVARARTVADTNDRWHIDSNGRMSWGGGSAAPVTTLFFGGTNHQLVSDSIAQNVSGAAEVWHPVTFANSWSNSASGANLQYRLVAAPYNCMQFVGRILAPAGIVAGQGVISALPGAYQPAHPQSVIGVDIATGGLVRFQMGTGGVLLYESGTVAGDNIDIPSGNGLVSLDA